jgi:hypothetical protein
MINAVEPPDSAVMNISVITRSSSNMARLGLGNYKCFLGHVCKLGGAIGRDLTRVGIGVAHQ